MLKLFSYASFYKPQTRIFKIQKRYKLRTYPRQPLRVITENGTEDTQFGKAVVHPSKEYVETALKQETSGIKEHLKAKDLMRYAKYGQKKDNVIVLEGYRLIKDALNAKAKLLHLFYTSEDLVTSLNVDGNEKQRSLVSTQEMQSYSNLTKTPGIMAIFKKPKPSDLQFLEGSLPVTVICDNVREPGNVGAILRCSAGAGCREVLLSKGCADVWDFKVIRSGMASHFKIPIQSHLHWESMNALVPEDSKVIVADNNLLRQDVSNAEFKSYYEVDYKNYAHIIVIVGGETEGLSDEAFKLASMYNGERIVIPLQRSIDSLNVGTALGIVLFEINRQLNKPV